METNDFIVAVSRLPEVMEYLNRLEDKLDRIIDAVPTREFVDIAWICSEIGCSRDFIRTHPWIAPNFGVPDVSGRPKRWRRETWSVWIADLNERKSAWQEMPAGIRRQILMKAEVCVKA